MPCHADSTAIDGYHVWNEEGIERRRRPTGSHGRITDL